MNKDKCTSFILVDYTEKFKLWNKILEKTNLWAPPKIHPREIKLKYCASSTKINMKNAKNNFSPKKEKWWNNFWHKYVWWFHFWKKKIFNHLFRFLKMFENQTFDSVLKVKNFLHHCEIISQLLWSHRLQFPKKAKKNFERAPPLPPMTRKRIFPYQKIVMKVNLDQKIENFYYLRPNQKRQKDFF